MGGGGGGLNRRGTLDRCVGGSLDRWWATGQVGAEGTGQLMGHWTDGGELDWWGVGRGVTGQVVGYWTGRGGGHWTGDGPLDRWWGTGLVGGWRGVTGQVVGNWTGGGVALDRWGLGGHWTGGGGGVTGHVGGGGTGHVVSHMTGEGSMGGS